MKGVLVLFISIFIAATSFGQCNLTIAPSNAGEGCIETNEAIVFDNISRSSVTENSITKTANGNAWNAGASSSSHVFVNGYVETTINQTNREKAFGLSTAKTSYNLNSIEFAFHLLSNGNIQIRESNTLRANGGTYTNGDVLRVWNDNGTIKYLKNEEVIYTSGLTPASALVLDISLRATGATFTNLSISNLTEGSFNAFATPGLGYFTWYVWTLNGTDVGNGNNQITLDDYVDGDVLICSIFTFSGACFGFQTSNQIILNASEDCQGTNWIGGMSSAWSQSGNWSGGVPEPTLSARIPAGTLYSPKIDQVSSVLTLTIDEGANIGFGDENSLQIHGNLENNGSFEPGDGIVAFSGVGTRSISGNPVPFNRFIANLTNATDSIICNTEVRIHDETVFIRGRIYTGSNELVYLNNATTREGSAASYVEGTCRKIGNQAFKFPVGKSGIYAPVAISAPAQNTDEFTATYRDQSPDDAGYLHTTQDGTLSTVSQCEFWMVNREVGISVVSVSLSYENERSCGVSDPSQLRVTRWDGTKWQNHGYLTHNGDFNAGMVTSGLPILNFSPFTLGSGTAINPLPIELLNFSAVAKGQQVEVEWNTLSEINNDYFTLERSADARDFEVIGVVSGAGNAQEISDYYFVDDAPLDGTSYYRLSQTDFNGIKESFPVQSVDMGNINSGIIYPNPCSGLFTIEFAGVEKERELNLYDLSGKLLWVEKSDKKMVQVHLPDQLNPGVYLIEIRTLHHAERQRIIIY